MAKPHKPARSFLAEAAGANPFAAIRDPAIRKQMEELAAKDAMNARNQEELESAPVRFIFTNPDLSTIAVGKTAEVVNTFGQRQGGTVTEKLSDEAYRVRVFDDLTVIVHANHLGWYDR